MDNLLVSIVVITYNSAKYVIETLESAKAQTCQNIELIVSDDSSVDNTVELCRNWIEVNKERFVTTKLITTPANTGVPANCNRGVKEAKGEWVKLIAGDDILLPECISRYLDFLSITESSFIFSDMIWFGNGREYKKDNVDGRDDLRENFARLDNKSQLKFYSRDPIFLNIPTVFINLNILKQVDFFDEDFRIFEDQSLILKWLQGGYSIAYMPYKTVKYRRHNDAIGSRIGINYIKELYRLFKKYRKNNLSLFSFKDLCYILDFYIFILRQSIYIKYHKYRYPFVILKYISFVKLFRLKPW